MRFETNRCALALLVASTMSGCQSIGDPGELTSDSLLKAAGTAPDAVTLDIYWARTSLDDQDFADALWQSVQEDRIPVEVRRALTVDGLRAGVVGGTPSEEILQLLNPDGVELDSAEQVAAPLSTAPAKVTRRLRQLRPDTRLEIQATDTPRAMPLLRAKSSGLVGHSYDDAQGIYAAMLKYHDANRAVIELSPELHHGQPRMKYTPSGPGMVVQKLGRDVEYFDDLRLEVGLAPGEILVVTCLPRAKNHLGGLFHHTTSGEAKQQKYLLVRLSHVPPTPALASSPDSAWPWN